MDFMSLIDHTIRGQISNEDVYGVHFYNPKRINIREIVTAPNELGIWKAKIDVFDFDHKIWTSKHKVTSFFPTFWSLTQLFDECEYAFNNKKKDEESESIFHSKTRSGINVKIIINKNNQIKSIFPTD